MPGRVRRRYKVKGLTDHGADKMMFFNEQAQEEMSVATYYMRQYNFPCVFSTPSAAHAAFAAGLLGLEVCALAGS